MDCKEDVMEKEQAAAPGLENAPMALPQEGPVSEEALRADSPPKSDLIAAVVLLAFGLYVLAESISMPAQTLSGGLWYVAPGVFPAFLGGVLCLLAVILGASAIRRAQGLQSLLAATRRRPDLGWLVRFGVISVSLVTYVLLFGKVGYTLLTFLFLASMMVFYEPERNAKRIAIDLVIALAAALAVSYGFRDLAKIPLP